MPHLRLAWFNRRAVGASWLVLFLLLSSGCMLHQESVPGHRTLRETGADLSMLPLPVQYALSADLGRDDPAYHLTPIAEGDYVAANPRIGLHTTLTPSDMQVRVGAHTWSLTLLGWGRGVDQRPVLGASAVEAEANRLAVTHGSLSVWHVNGPLGLQQGCTVDAPPPGSDGPLTLALLQD